MNRVILKGRLARDPEVRTTQSGKQVARFTVACDKRGKDAGADFITCVAWEKTAELVGNYWTKGKEILAEGSISTRSYEKDGQKKYVTEVNVYNVEFCGSKDGGKTQLPGGIAGEEVDDDIPF